jgi:hypothetical protein
MKTAEEILKSYDCSRMTTFENKYGGQMDGDDIISMMEEFALQFINNKDKLCECDIPEKSIINENLCKKCMCEIKRV